MYLTEIKMKEIQSKLGNNNWIFIYDRSWSMGRVISQLGNDIIRLSKTIKTGDTLSLGYFSGEGQYRFVLKGYQITDNSYDAIEKVVRDNMSTIGMTCFSEILGDTVQVIEELKTTFPDNTFVMCFLTDGQPVPGGSKEKSDIFKAIDKLKTVIGDALIIGYGDYYGKELLHQITSELGGSFVHADSIQDFTDSVELVIKNGGSSRKIEIDVSGQEDIVLVFGKSNNQIKVYPHSNGKALVSDKENEVFVVTGTAPKKTDDNLDNLYAAAYSLASQGKISDSLDWLGKIGDKFLVDKLNNAFTTSEIGEAVQFIHSATFDSSKRLLDGHRKNYVPKVDAFCILDAIDTLVKDNDAYFYPNHSKWSYKKIGISGKVKEGYSKFTKENTQCPFASLTMNKNRLNLSIRTTIPGTIQLDENYIAYNLDKKFNTYQWKNFSIIADGILNVRMLPVSLSEESFKILKAGKLIKRNEKFVAGEIYVLDMKRIPIMNRSIANSYKSAKVLGDYALHEQTLMAELKTAKYLMNKINPGTKATPFTERYTPEQVDYLIEQGIRNDGSFGPPVESVESVDCYMANTFDIKVSGFSSIPSIEKVIGKVEGKKKLNYCESIINDYLNIVKDEDSLVLASEISIKGKNLQVVRNHIQRAKFAVILGKGKFDEFDSNEGEIELDNVKVKFVFGEKKVKF